MPKKAHASQVHQPHDHLIKKLLANPATARDILSLYLPPEVLEVIDLNVLELQRDSFIDDEHRAFAVDLLYKTTFQGKPGYLWILLEHQYQSDPWMPVRLFKYIAIIWDHLRKLSKSKKIPLIYPVVIYNGPRPYTHSLTLSDLITPKASKKLFANLFTQPFCLIDLASIKDETLRQHMQEKIKGIALLMTLKHIVDKDLQSFFEQTLVGALKRLEQMGSADEVADVLYYVLNEGRTIEEERFWTVLHEEFSPNVEGKVMTIAQKLEERGLKRGFDQGMEKGMEKGKLEVAKHLLSENEELSKNELIVWVHRMTGLSLKKIRELQKKN